MNRLWSTVGLQRPLDADHWIAAAEDRAGLTFRGDRTPFSILAASLRDEGRLHPLGRAIVEARIVGAIRGRLEVEASVFGEEPAVQPPLFIVGLQRTGTTLLHRLLAAHPDLRALHSYEALAPVPRRAERGAERRTREAQLASRALQYLAPDIVVVHPVEPLDAEEEVVLFEGTGLTTGFEATLRVPTFAAWLEEQDQTPAYRHLRRCLGLIDGRRRWVLKTPHHLEFLRELIATFPDARLVWTHRDPTVTVPSFCSMVAHAHGLCSDDVEPLEIGTHWLRKTSRMVEHAETFRAAHPALPILDVAYDDLVADPVATVERVLAFADVPVDESARRRIEARREKARAHGPGRHVYRAEDFGLTADMIAARFPHRG